MGADWTAYTRWTELQQNFEKAIQNFNRFVLKKDQNGHPTNSLSEHARITVKSDGPLFNEWTGYVFFHVTAKAQRMEKLFQSLQDTKLFPGKYSLQHMLEMRIPGGDYLMGPCLMALQDNYMATMFWAKMSNLSSKRSFYEKRLVQYTRLDGTDGRRDMRRELQVTLESCLNAYPEVLQNVRKARTRTSSDRIEACGASVNLTTGLDEIDNWATGTGPAGPSIERALNGQQARSRTLSSHPKNYL
jgi:hypothetical protein